MRSTHARRRIAAILSTAVVAALGTVVGAPAASAAPAELFFSEYIEGSSNNKALEIYNGTGAPVDLGPAGYNVQMFFNGNPVSTLTINLTGSVADGDVYVLAHSSAVAAVLAQADQTNGSGWFNGDDAVVLRKGTAVVDAFGQLGFDPGTEWGSGLTSTADNTLRRKAEICAGDPDGSNAFDPSIEWDGFATDTFGGLGAHTAACGVVVDAAPAVASTFPINGATEFHISGNLTVTFTEPVNVTSPWFDLSCSVSGPISAAITGGPTTFTLDPATDLSPGETCTLTVSADSVFDQDTIDPPDTMAANYVISFVTVDQCTLDYTPIPAIQGSSATVALTGTQTTQGVVVGDYEGASPNLRGFFIQDPTGDTNPATSDGIFVFEGSNADTVSLGDVVRVTGNAGENQGQSQISVGTIVKCGTGTVTPTDVTFPVASATALEQYEGMLVRLPQTMYVTEHFQLGRFGQVVLSEGGRLQQPTNVVAPDAPALQLQAENNLRKIILDDASQAQNPDPILFARGGAPLSASNTLRGGDTATGIVGVLNYTWGGQSSSPNAYRVRPISALNGYFNFEAVNMRPADVPQVGGSIQVAGMNVLNYFNTWDGLPDTVDNCTLGVGGPPDDCRGADTEVEFERQTAKTVAAIVGSGAAVIALGEIENDGYGPDSAVATLVDELNEATAPGTWAYIDVDAATFQVNALGTDAIKVDMIHQPALVTPIGATAVLNTEEFVTGGDEEDRNRPALAQAFVDNSTGGAFVAVANHFKSKGSACDAPDAGDGQGNCNDVREAAATRLAEWLSDDPTGTGDEDILIMGDLNSYAMEDPINVLKNAGYTNLIESLIGPDAYSYVFDGQWGYLDHALGSASAAEQVAGVGVWHINADEPSVLDYNTDFKSAGQVASLFAPDEFRSSDHDPVIVGLDLASDTDGSVTGGGWFRGEEGKTTFGMSIRYAGSVTVPPTGDFDMNVPGGQFSLSVDKFRWLTIDGSTARFGADASVNGMSGYSVHVTITDGGKKSDTIAVVVRDEAGVIVYDSGEPVRITGQVTIRP